MGDDDVNHLVSRRFLSCYTGMQVAQAGWLPWAPAAVPFLLGPALPHHTAEDL